MVHFGYLILLPSQIAVHGEIATLEFALGLVSSLKMTQSKKLPSMFTTRTGTIKANKLELIRHS